MTLAVRPLLLAGVALSLLAGITGGLLRAGVALPALPDATWPGQAALAHAALMICGFLGTVIGIERAVAVKLRAAFLAPLASGAGGALLLLGQPGPGAWLIVAAAAIFTAVNIVIVRRQRAAHTWLLLVAAGAWLAGNLLFATGQGSVATLPWWFAFLVMTIAAERLEMTRLMRRRPAAELSLQAVLAALLAGAAWSALAPVAGGLLYGTALTLLALWLAVFDIARHTVRAHGLSRYMAVCLLGGYAWLAVAGVAWAATALGLPLRDAALHALGLGFIVSMMMGHAPVILPAIARVKLQFGAFFYVPLAVLHLSLLLRLVAGMAGDPLHSTGALLNAAAIALFAATIAGAAVAWRIQHGGPDAPPTRKTSS
ncbi:MAG: hypothetical protein B7X65_09435 [Polaromonas sp. 39-63-25]|nr:MAG: hypothetical protein B7Y60_00195 [Polaromonas sp. 35-63-35]OYZ22830.1 MAG: hypothetical protein B7Y28_00195 [Polaromonas sp. 16-63-31]OYZ81488.1 MAG: hypothetical protein B7Y09_02960 [Polaromonas sp. 24-63-21]OZA53045.1 MAG: hypothetical protein B7X88_00190 [Polaromonas sp. 17-63-33]OZA88850.1 MAG: hypothetical protein B7X65_09435 [Polaromonas sp. 39-63-25]